MTRPAQWSSRTVQLGGGRLLHMSAVVSAYGQAHCAGIVADDEGAFSRRLSANGCSLADAELELRATAYQLIEEGGAAEFPARAPQAL